MGVLWGLNAGVVLSVPALEMWMQEGGKLKAILCYIETQRPAWAM